MKKHYSIKRVFSIVLVLFIIFGLVPTADVNAASKKGWVTKKGYKYYYDDNMLKVFHLFLFQ